jgi:Arc/MetJ-type ribon-helix-helix transcriptional regulator
MATITLRLPDPLDAELERQSRISGWSKSDLAREAIRRYLQVAQFRSLRAQLVPLAEAQQVFTDEDVFSRLDSPENQACESSSTVPCWWQPSSRAPACVLNSSKPR